MPKNSPINKEKKKDEAASNWSSSNPHNTGSTATIRQKLPNKKQKLPRYNRKITKGFIWFFLKGTVFE
jgi:hypothetical protein